MGFHLRNIDRSIEWAVRDECIARGFWPDERTFIANDDQAGFEAALAAISNRYDVFGTGNYDDRAELKRNSIIITRKDTDEGTIGSYPYYLELQTDSTYTEKKAPEGSNTILYEIRFVAFKEDDDRNIEEILLKVIGKRNFLMGMNDDLTNQQDGFWIFKTGTADISDVDFIERIYMYAVVDVFLGDDQIIEAGIPAAKTVSPIMSPAKVGDDLLYQDNELDIQISNSNVIDYYLDLARGLPAWSKMLSVRMYAQETEAQALKNLIPANVSAVNNGLTFTKYKGFYIDSVGDYLDTKVIPSKIFQLTNYSYMVFVTIAPNASLMELFGLIDSGNNVSFFMKGSNAIGIQTKANSNTLLSDSTLRVKANTLYTLNRRDRFKMQLFENDQIILELDSEPIIIPQGTIFDLNIASQTGTVLGVGTIGGLAFSAAGKGLRGSDIKDMNLVIRNYLTRIGLLM